MWKLKRNDPCPVSATRISSLMQMYIGILKTILKKNGFTLEEIPTFYK